jgi:hypothetical protein
VVLYTNPSPVPPGTINLYGGGLTAFQPVTETLWRGFGGSQAAGGPLRFSPLGRGGQADQCFGLQVRVAVVDDQPQRVLVALTGQVESAGLVVNRAERVQCVRLDQPRADSARYGAIPARRPRRPGAGRCPGTRRPGNAACTPRLSETDHTPDRQRFGEMRSPTACCDWPSRLLLNGPRLSPHHSRAGPEHLRPAEPALRWMTSSPTPAGQA